MFRQTMFAEFEKIAHEQVEKGGAVTADSLCEVYRGLNLDYYGAEVDVDPEIDIEWARVPHFYSAFYVYKYATGFSAANALADGILAGKPQAVDRYLEFLSAGSSDYPLNVLAKAGVDMSSRLRSGKRSLSLSASSTRWRSWRSKACDGRAKPGGAIRDVARGGVWRGPHGERCGGACRLSRSDREGGLQRAADELREKLGRLRAVPDST